MVNSSTAEFEAAPATRLPSQIALRNWPLIDEPLTAWPMLLAGAALAVGAAMLFSAPLVGAVVGAVFALTLWRLWLPVRFEFGPSGVAQIVLGRRSRIAWSSIADYRMVGKGIALSPFADPPLQKAMRGIYIFCGARHAEVVACLEYYLRTTMRAPQ